MAVVWSVPAVWNCRNSRQLPVLGSSAWKVRLGPPWLPFTGYGPGFGGWGWLAMSLSMVIFWALIIGVGVLLFRALAHSPQSRNGTSPEDRRPAPEQILAERFARGEIDENEYTARLAALRGRSKQADP
jgi:putative membrane protein